MGIKFYKKNILDLSNTLPSFTVSDSVATNTGQDFVSLMRNRNNNSGWATTGSTDAGTTTMVVSFGETKTMTRILLLGHNFKSFTLKYWNGVSWTDFSTPISETTNTYDSTFHSFTEVATTQLQLIINGTQTPNADKYLKQFIVTESLGEFSIEPEVRPQWDKDRKITKFISGKSYVAKSVGAFNVNLKMKSAYNDADLTLVESLFNTYEGFLVSLCGGTETQFTDGVRQGYRLEDIFLMDVSNEYSPEYIESRWANGLPIDLKLVEVN